MAFNARKTNLAKIHIAKKNLGLDDATYREALQTVTGKTSAKDLTLVEMLRVLAHFEKRGFKPKTKAKKPMQKRPHTFNVPERERYMRKIEALMLDGGYTWDYIHGMTQKMFNTARIEWVQNPEDLRKIVAALSCNAKRKGRAYAREQA